MSAVLKKAVKLNHSLTHWPTYLQLKQNSLGMSFEPEGASSHRRLFVEQLDQSKKFHETDPLWDGNQWIPLKRLVKQKKYYGMSSSGHSEDERAYLCIYLTVH